MNFQSKYATTVRYLISFFLTDMEVQAMQGIHNNLWYFYEISLKLFFMEYVEHKITKRIKTQIMAEKFVYLLSKLEYEYHAQLPQI